MAKESPARIDRRSFLMSSLAAVISPFLPSSVPDPYQSNVIGKNKFLKVPLKNVDEIRERVFETSEDIHLAKALFSQIEVDLEKYPHAYALYLDREEPELLWGFLSSGMDDRTDFGFRDDFKRLLGRVNPRTRLDTLLLLELYGRSYGRSDFGLKRIEELYKGGIQGLEIADEILGESRGILLWNHQLQNLIQASVGGRELDLAKVILIRKGINAQKTEIWKLLKTMKIENKLLYDVLQERMIFSFTSYPYFRGAVALYQTIKKTALSTVK